MKHEFLIWTALFSVVLYPIVMRILARAVQPTRLKMATSGGILLESPRLAVQQKNLILSMLKDAYDFRVAILLVLFMPAFVCAVVFGSVRVGQAHADMRAEKEEFQKFSSYHMLSVAAANPLFFLLLIVETAVLSLVLVPAVLFRRQYSDATATDFVILASTKVDKQLRYLAV